MVARHLKTPPAILSSVPLNYNGIEKVVLKMISQFYVPVDDALGLLHVGM